MNKKNLLKLLSLVLSVMMIMTVFAGCGGSANDKGSSSNSGSDSSKKETTETTTTQKDHGASSSTLEDKVETKPLGNNSYADTINETVVKVEMVIENYGTIKLDLYADLAPATVENFVNLVNDGFYNGLYFHRIMEGFMMQGGDPDRNGTGGSEKEIVGEFGANGFSNPISHVRGAISMARSQEYDSASSQFFIVHEDSTFLDGEYAAFGMVTEGIEIVDKICTEAEPTDDNGSIALDNQPRITEIKIVE